MTMTAAIFASSRCRSSMYWPSTLAAAPKQMKTNEKPRMKKIEATSTRRRAAPSVIAASPVPCISSSVSPEMYER